MTPIEVRGKLVEALGLDLIGPDRDSEHLAEVLPQPPSRWYLTGFLVPQNAPEDQREDATAGEGAEELRESAGADDSTTSDAPPRRAFFPSSIGVSLLVPAAAKELRVTACWGDYQALDEKGEPYKDEGQGPPARWRRTDRREEVTLRLVGQDSDPDAPRQDRNPDPRPVEAPNSDKLFLEMSVRSVHMTDALKDMVPDGTQSVSVFLVNRRRPAPDPRRDEAFIFQAALEVRSDVPLQPRPNLRGAATEDRDELIADLQYRDAFEYAVGHGVATQAVLGEGGLCREVHTRWIPGAQVEHVAPERIEGVELSMEGLAVLTDGADARAKLIALVERYREWITTQKATVPAKEKKRKATANELLNYAGVAANRIEAGIALLADPTILDAFRMANKTMAAAYRRRFGAMLKQDPADLAPPKWRPFQLAFLLMNLPGVADPGHADREVVDLLFFPTGGGKTEAYLALAAFTLVLRRLRHPGVTSAGLSVLMRYTLRLLTLDQLSRAATLMCALELERRNDVDRLGEWPFEIGLWVGRGATPNEMGTVKDRNRDTARSRTIAYKNNSRKASPIPLEECPWCGTRFTPRGSFDLTPDEKYPTDLRLRCVNRDCAFSREHTLPILAVDEPIYRRLPCFLIATVDKFAAMPWTGPVGGFFGRVDRYDKQGFYGPCHPQMGRPLPGPLQPPDLVIQDELHLISGPLGTIVGLYETALDELCAREVNGKRVRPKIIASTATVRRAEGQIQALFNRALVDVFPPPGPDRRNSFFARTHRPNETNARLYLGVAAQGRSPKVMLLRVYLALLGAAQKAYVGAGGDKNPDNPADPYMTLLGYFNSLRELGGSRRIIEDEVGPRLSDYGTRKRLGETEGLFADRRISYEVVELTSRVRTDQVADAKRKLTAPFPGKEHVDVAIATNMISVGLDITRLGLMVVLGQPKTSAEYIQATSRVGRDANRPGLVVTLMNIHRPRDRSHYERFAFYHQSFYRSVEATSVTPFSPRALDRGLAGAVVGLARLAHTPLTPAKGATEILRQRASSISSSAPSPNGPRRTAR